MISLIHNLVNADINHSINNPTNNSIKNIFHFIKNHSLSEKYKTKDMTIEPTIPNAINIKKIPKTSAYKEHTSLNPNTNEAQKSKYAHNKNK